MKIQQLTLLEPDASERTPPTNRRAALNFRDLGRWAKMQVKWIARRSQADKQSELFLYTQAAKLVEEVGELHAELLGRSRLQRNEKMPRFNQESLGNELADVVICVAILAEVADVDLAQALIRKMAVVDRRVFAADVDAAV